MPNTLWPQPHMWCCVKSVNMQPHKGRRPRRVSRARRTLPQHDFLCASAWGRLWQTPGTLCPTSTSPSWVLWPRWWPACWWARSQVSPRLPLWTHTRMIRMLGAQSATQQWEYSLWVLCRRMQAGAQEPGSVCEDGRPDPLRLPRSIWGTQEIVGSKVKIYDINIFRFCPIFNGLFSTLYRNRTSQKKPPQTFIWKLATRHSKTLTRWLKMLKKPPNCDARLVSRGGDSLSNHTEEDRSQRLCCCSLLVHRILEYAYLCYQDVF